MFVSLLDLIVDEILTFFDEISTDCRSRRIVVFDDVLHRRIVVFDEMSRPAVCAGGEDFGTVLVHHGTADSVELDSAYVYSVK